MTDPRGVGIYSGLLRVYPRRFRNEYGTDMALLFAQQLRDEPAARVWARCIIDLAITIPTQHLETHMNRPPNPAVPAIFAAIGVSGIAFVGIGGSNLAMVAVGLGIAAVAGVLAIASWRHARTISDTRPAAERWWQILLAGISMLATSIVVLNIVGEVSEAWWLPMMLALLAGTVATAAGLILGAIHHTEHRSLAG